MSLGRNAKRKKGRHTTVCLMAVLLVPLLTLTAQETATKPDSKTVESLLKKGFQLHQAGHYAEALKVLRQAQAEEPHDYFANLLMGIDLLRTGQRNEAIPYLREATHQRPNQEFAYEYLGEAHAGSGDFAAAIGDYQNAVSVAPASAEAAKGGVGFYLGRFAELAGALRSTRSGLSYSYRLQAMSDAKGNSKVELLKRACTLSENAPGIWSELAIGQFMAGDFAGAKESAHTASKKDSNDLRAWLATALLAAKEQNWQQAGEALDRIGTRSKTALVMAMEDWQPDLLPTRAGETLPKRATIFLGCVRTGRQTCSEKVLRSDLPDEEQVPGVPRSVLFRQQRWERVAAQPAPAKTDGEAWSQRGIALGTIGRCGEALTTLERALFLKAPMSDQAQFFLSICYASEAGTITENLERAGGQSAAIHLLRGDVLLRLRGDAAGALSEYQSAQSMDPNNPAVWERLAAAQFASGDLAGARQSADSALKLDPLRMSAKRILAKLAMEDRDYPRAADLLRSITEQDPKDVSAKVDLANACAQSGQAQEAYSNLAPALASGYPDEKGSLHYVLGTVLRKLGKDDEARKAFAQAKELSQRFESASHGDQSARP